jgi:hypothetical protein
MSVRVSFVLVLVERCVALIKASRTDTSYQRGNLSRTKTKSCESSPFLQINGERQRLDRSSQFARPPRICRKSDSPEKTRRRAARFHCPISLIVTAASLSLNPDFLRATGVCLHVDLFASVCIDDLERGGRIIQSHRLDLGLDREGISDG